MESSLYTYFYVISFFAFERNYTVESVHIYINKYAEKNWHNRMTFFGEIDWKQANVIIKNNEKQTSSTFENEIL